MVLLLGAALRSRQRPLRRTLGVPFGAFELRIGPKASSAIVARLAAVGGTHNARRPIAERLVRDHFARQYARSIERAQRAGLSPRVFEPEELADALATSREIRRVVDRIWPSLTPERLLADLFATPALLREAADGVLNEAEWSLLVRPRDAAREVPAFSAADLPLLDEVLPWLGSVVAGAAKRRPQSAEDVAAIVDRALDDLIPMCPECGAELTYAEAQDRRRPWVCEARGCENRWASSDVLSPEAASQLAVLRERLTATVTGERADEAPLVRTYGHVVVDEAQDLSPMQWRVLARRCPSGSMTIVGDLGQASGLWAPESWQEIVDLIQTPRASVVELTVNYRTPHEVMELAGAVLAAARPDLTPARSVRDANVSPRFERATSSDLVARAVEIAGEEFDAIAGGGEGDGAGKVAVIAPSALVADLQLRLAARPDLAAAGADVLEAPVSVLTVDDAKGLEFDAVVVAEPSAIAAEHPHGLGALYVALTRTTTRLAVVHADALPAPMVPREGR